MSVRTRLRHPLSSRPGGRDNQPAPPDQPGQPAPPDQPDLPDQPAPPGQPDQPGQPAPRVHRYPRVRRAAGLLVDVLACLLVLFALLAPDRLGALGPAAFARIPVEALVGAVLVLVLPVRARRAVAVLGGGALGVLAVVKVLDMGFYAVLARPFDLVLDWIQVGNAVEFLTSTIGRAGALAAAAAVGLLALAVVVLTALALLRLSGVVARRPDVATRVVAVLAVVWLACAGFGVELAPGEPFAARSAVVPAYERGHQVRAGLADQAAFARESAVDPFATTPGDRLLTGLRGKDVMVAFVESYGRDAVEDPEFAPGVDAVLDDGTRRLTAAGFSSRSAYLTSSTAGGGSWLAHATLLSGLWINNQQRYRNLVTTDRLTLNGAFRRAGWRTVGVMPGVTRAWPEGEFYGYDQVYDSRTLGYRGPHFSWAPMPDQYALAAYERLEHGRTGRPPLMTEIPMVSSHGPWAPVPRLIGWDDVGDGSVFAPMAAGGDRPDDVWKDRTRIRAAYRTSIEYSLQTLVSYLETYGDDDTVLVFLGDHQPTPVVTGEGAGRDVPITIVAKDPAVLAQISGWGWQDGLRPGPQSPVWRMDTFRDRFLTAFSPAR